MNSRILSGNKRGMNLIELIMAVVIGGIIFYSFLNVFISATFKGASMEALTGALFLANGKLETVVSKRFTSITSEALSSFGGPFPAYYSQVTVNYVSPEALDTVTDPTVTAFKRVIVRVTAPAYSLGTVEVRGLVTDMSNP